jgi:hypothetical protein
LLAVIPHVIHRVWLGDQEMPEEFKEWGETWQRHHPEWEMRLWTDDNLPELRYPDALERCRNHGEASDVLRSEILYQFGGVYVDTDVECRRSIEELIADAKAFAAWVRPGRIGSAVLGAEPEHPAIERLLTEMKDRVGQMDQIEATVGLLTEVLSEADDVTLFGPETFYPYHPRHAPADQGESFEDAYAIHHWSLTWKSREDLRERVRSLRDRVEYLEGRIERLKAQKERATVRIEKSKERTTRLRRHNEDLTARVRRTRLKHRDTKRRLSAMQRSRWWRLRGRLVRALGPARPIARRLRARSAR